MEVFGDILFIGIGVFIALLGLLLIGRDAYWRRHAARVTGTIVGVKIYSGRKGRRGRTGADEYHAVYRYTLPDGEAHEGIDYGGDVSKRRKETGRQEGLAVFPDDPSRVRACGGSLRFWAFLLLVFPGAIVILVQLAMPPESALEWGPIAIGLAVCMYFSRQLGQPPSEDRSNFWRSSTWGQNPREGIWDLPTETIATLKDRK